MLGRKIQEGRLPASQRRPGEALEQKEGGARDPRGHLGRSAQGPGSHTATRRVAEHRANSPPAWPCAPLASTLRGRWRQILLYKEESNQAREGDSPRAPQKAFGIPLDVRGWPQGRLPSCPGQEH